MSSYVTQQDESQLYSEWLTKKVEQARASADAGNLVSAADVEAHFAAPRAAVRERIEGLK